MIDAEDDSTDEQYPPAIAQAIAIRRQLLDRLGAEPEWVLGNDQSATMSWAPGPGGTLFTVSAPSAAVSVASLDVVSTYATTDNLDAARFMVDLLNGQTSAHRWAVLGDPGPSGWQTDSSLSLDEQSWQTMLIAPGAEDSIFTVATGLSFMFGDHGSAVSIDAIELMTREQIAKAQALITNEAWKGWGQPVIADWADTGMREAEDWNRVLWHYDDRCQPNRFQSPVPLMGALSEAFELVQAEQNAEEVAVWLGSGDEHSFTCEVPYGDGDFEGVVAFGPPPRDPRLSTSLVQAFSVDTEEAQNPELGLGVIMTMRLPQDCAYQVPIEWVTHLLNARMRTNSELCSAFSAHGLGAWVVRDDDAVWTLFVPSYWSVELSLPDLVTFFRSVLLNCARLSWASRAVFEPLATGRVSPQPGGFMAGRRARGATYGEPSSEAGQNLVDRTWELLVGHDHEWASQHPDGFRYQLTGHSVKVTTQRCGCPHRGALVSIQTPLVRTPTPQARELALHLQADHGSFTITEDIEGLIANTVLHVHSDSLYWQERFPTAIAVAQALYAEHLDSMLGDSAMPWLVECTDRGARTDRDGMLDLFNPEAPHQQNIKEVFAPASLALAPLWSGINVVGLAWSGDNVDCTWVSEDLDDPESQRFTTNLGAYLDPIVGPVLRLRTPIDLPNDCHLYSWALQANNSWDDTTRAVIGGFGVQEGKAYWTTSVPISLASGDDAEALATWAGTMLSYHGILGRAVSTHLGVPATPADIGPLLVGLPAFYRRTTFIATNISIELADENQIVIRRPYGDRVSATSWPTLGTFSDGAVVTSLDWRDPERLRLIHATIVALAPMDAGRTSVALFDRQALWPSLRRITAAMDWLVESGTVALDDDGDWVINDENGALPNNYLRVAMVDGHPVWDRCLLLEMYPINPGQEPARREPGNQIGAWSQDGDRDWRYRICLPAAAFASTNLEQHSRLIQEAALLCAAALYDVAG